MPCGISLLFSAQEGVNEAWQQWLLLLLQLRCCLT
jgi:hypothetical protein